MSRHPKGCGARLEGEEVYYITLEGELVTTWSRISNCSLTFPHKNFCGDGGKGILSSPQVHLTRYCERCARKLGVVW